MVNRYSSFGGEVEGRDDVPLFLGCSIAPEAGRVGFNRVKPCTSLITGGEEALPSFTMKGDRDTPSGISVSKSILDSHPLTSANRLCQIGANESRAS